MRLTHILSHHAHNRSTERKIPAGIAEMIIEYGASRDAGDGARKFGLSGDSMLALRRDFGRELVKVVEPYRQRGAYVVAEAEKVITVAFAGKPVFR